jgi:hypothetical protein
MKILLEVIEKEQDLVPLWIGLVFLSIYVFLVLYQSYRFRTKKCPKCGCKKFKIKKCYDSFSVYKCTNEKCTYERARFFNYSNVNVD